MANKEFREKQFNCRYDAHIAEINEYVDSLRENSSRGWAPYVAPLYGGVNARLLSVLRDPGPKTQDEVGSGFICMENDDQTAEALYSYYKVAGIASRDIMPWNAYPWYINKKPLSSQLKAGAETIAQLLALLKHVQVVMLHGNEAHRAWNYLPELSKQLVITRNIEVIKTFHPSRMAFIHRDPNIVAARRQHVIDAFHKAASILKSRWS
jgi:hypothetical protein